MLSNAASALTLPRPGGATGETHPSVIKFADKWPDEGTERQGPDVLLLQTNLSGSVSDIQDDPDSPDSNWLTYITNNVNTVCHVSFPTPTGRPREGAGLQEFKIWVRQQPDGAGADPTVRIELYENGGSLATVLADTAVSSTSGTLYSGTWNANLLANGDGSLVECYVYGTAVSGAPGNRCTVEVGAVEWNVTYGNSYYYWMVYSPMPGGYENPWIVGSNDAEAWEEPSGISNPVDTPPVDWYNSDPHLLYNAASDELWLYYRQGNAVDTDRIYLRKSSDGAAWGAKTLIKSGGVTTLLSPAVEKVGSTYHLWIVDMADSYKVKHATSADGETWGALADCTISQPAHVFWHVDAHYIQGEGKFWLMPCAYPTGGGQGANMPLFMHESLDGVTWTERNLILDIGASGQWDAKGLYRGSFVAQSDTSFQLWYGGISAADAYRIGYTLGVINRSVFRRVAAITDDCYYQESTAVWETNIVVFRAGCYNATNYHRKSGARFLNIPVPKGANIVTAYLDLKSRADQTLAGGYLQALTKVKAEDTDDAATFSTSANFLGRARTAGIDWDIDDWLAAVWYESPEIKTQIQTVVDRANWVSGNDMVLFWEDDDSPHADKRVREASSFEEGLAKCPKFYVEYAMPIYYHGLKVQGVGELALCDVGSHPLRIRKGGTTYGIELVDTGDPNASAIRIKMPGGIKALRKYT